MLDNIVNTINDIVWSPALVVLLICAGLYFTIRTKCFQLRRVGLLFRMVKEGREDIESSGIERKSVSSFEAFCISLSGRIGSGNIVGVAMAIALGGPGAVFWMWVIAFLGASTSFIESTLAQVYREQKNNIWTGGPFYYIEKGLKQKWLGILLAVFTISSYGALLVCVQSNCISAAFERAFSVPPICSGLVVVILLGAVIVGGARRIARISSIVAPFMSFAYLLLALIIIALHWYNIPSAFLAIFKGALGLDSALSGILGSTIAMGVKRGLFSNEAGQGGGAIVAASASVDMPAKQGAVQAFSVYVDTLLICTATALMILTSGTYNVFDPTTREVLIQNNPALGDNYVSFAQASIDSIFSGFGSCFVALALAFFVFTSLMAYYFYSRSALNYLCSRSGISGTREKLCIRGLQLLILLMLVLGAISSQGVAWTIGDIGVGLTTWINVIAILILCPKALVELKELEKKYPKKK